MRHARALAATRDFGTTRALHEVDLDVHAGEFLGVLGPNGAGKTTLLSLLTGLRAPTSGHVELFGGDPRQPRNRLRLGSTPQHTDLPSTPRVHEIVEFVAGHYPNPVPSGEILERFGLDRLRLRRAGSLSDGQQHQLGVALAFVGRPDLVVLDEPTTGLDVNARQALWRMLRDYHDAGGTLLLTSHYLEEIEALAHRVVVVDGGRVRFDGTAEDIRSTVGLRMVSLRTEILPELPGIVRLERRGDRTHLLTRDADRLVRDLVTTGSPFHDLRVHAASLEEAFLALTADHRCTHRRTTQEGTS